MRSVTAALLILALGNLSWAQQPASKPADPPTSASAQDKSNTPAAAQSSITPQSSQASGLTSSAPGTVYLPTVTKKDAAEAKREFEAGVKFREKGELQPALEKFSRAVELNPNSLDYITAREFAREQLALQSLREGNKAMQQGNDIVAMAAFQQALQYDPTNEYALQRLRDAAPEDNSATEPMSVVTRSTPIELQPVLQHHDFHFRGDVRALLTEVTRAYGITAEFDDSVRSRRVHFDIEDVNFATAIQAAEDVTKTFFIPLSGKQAFFLADTVENRRQFERYAIQTFYLPDATDQELAEMANSLRVLLNLRFISQDKAQNTITIRAEPSALQAAERIIKSLTAGAPELLLDVRVYAVSATFARSLGTALPTQFTMFHIDQSLLAGLGANSQNLINQLIASGGINQANAQAIQALLAQLANSSTSSILSQPFVVFGGGLTLFGLTAGATGLQFNFSVSDSDIKSLEAVTLRASHNSPAVMKIGQRYPIVNATYAPIYNNSSIARVIGNQSYIAPVPSFNFEDLGVNLKATPWVHDNEDVSLKIELQLRTLAGQNVNGIPIIANREYNGTITVKNGESSVVTGLIDMSDSRTITGYPYLGQIPALGYGASVHDKNVNEDELLVVITPHITRLPARDSFAVQLPPMH